MDAEIERIYIIELLMQCAYAWDVANTMSDILNMPNSPEKIPRFFREAGYFLQHTSAISRLLWPAKTGSNDLAKKRGSHLCEMLKVNEDHILNKRHLRNHFEHIDERLDDWGQNSPHHNLVYESIGSRTNIRGDVITDKDVFRLFNPQTSILSFRGEEYNVLDMVNGVRDIQSKAHERMRQINILIEEEVMKRCGQHEDS